MSIADAGQLARLRALRGADARPAQSPAPRDQGLALGSFDVSEPARPRGPAAYVTTIGELDGATGAAEDSAAISAEARQLAARDATSMTPGRKAVAAPSLPRWHPMHAATRAYTSALGPSGEQGPQVSPSAEPPPRGNVSWVA